jgi:hypothetical protein
MTGAVPPETARGMAFDARSSAMISAVMGAAQREQVLRLVPTAFFASSNVVHIDESRVPAARHLAAVFVPPQHQAPHRRRHRLSRFLSALGRPTWASSFGPTGISPYAGILVVVSVTGRRGRWPCAERATRLCLRTPRKFLRFVLRRGSPSRNCADGPRACSVALTHVGMVGLTHVGAWKDLCVAARHRRDLIRAALRLWGGHFVGGGS